MGATHLVGIDLGTTHSVVASADLSTANAPSIFAVPQLIARGSIAARPLLPSCLYAPLHEELSGDPWGDAPWIVGEYARARGAEVAGRVVASAKSWLCHPRVDRSAPILPWGASEEASDVPRISPVDASRAILGHIQSAWNAEHPRALLKGAEVVLTVPASFDEVARELTVEAAERAGITVRLLEEPQAAFYDWMQRSGPDALRDLVRRAGGEALVLVCDVGGGTTDLSLLRVREEGGEPAVDRVAVGSHLLLGGDNMDLALAHLVEPRLVAGGDPLDPPRFAQLVLACRAAKERLLGRDAPDEAPITLLGHSSRLIGATLRASLARAEVEGVILGGFFPEASRDDRPRRERAGLVAVGLPYEKDPALTRHVASFLARHASSAPTALLLNGGVFRSARVIEALIASLRRFGGDAPFVLPNADPDLAVARGAVTFGLALRGRGLRIGGGSARGFYIGLDAPRPERSRRALCVVPRGAEEGLRHVVTDRALTLTVGEPVRFDVFTSDTRGEDAVGDVVTIDDETFDPLPKLTTTLQAQGSARSEVPVALEGELSAVGTLDIACVERDAPSPRRFRLSFQLREPDAAESPASESGASASAPSIGGKRLEEALAAIREVFGSKRSEAGPREAKNLLRELERILGERGGWTTETARALGGELVASARARRRSAEHERAYWLVTGFCMRPGFGHPLDAARMAKLVPLFAEGLAFPAESRGFQQFWIAWRRLSGGLDEAAQTALRDAIDPLLAPASAKLKKPKGVRLEAAADLLDLASSLERLDAARRSELGSWILERTWTESDPKLWTAIGRLGARIPAYASAHHVVGPRIAERWIDHLLRERWDALPSAVPAIVTMARMTGDRARDIGDGARREVERRLVKEGVRDEALRAVREVVATTDADRVAIFGDALPVGLRLVDE